jgi:hypothetical protein
MADVLVLSGSKRFAEEAARYGLAQPEQAIEEAICQGRKRARPLDGLRLELAPQERFVVVNENIGAVVRKAGHTGGGRAKYVAIKLWRLQPRRSLQ